MMANDEQVVLLVEPNRDDQIAMTEMLQQSGFRVEVVEDGESAIILAERLHPDIAMIEYDIPDEATTGYELCETLLAEQEGAILREGETHGTPQANNTRRHVCAR